MSSTTTTSSDSTADLIPSLPYDVASNCLARLPRHYHPTLSLLSKPIRSLLSSPFFFTTRSLLNSAQHLLYLTLRSPDHRSTWFTLHQNPNPQNDDAAVPRLLVPIPPVPVPAVGAAYAVVGPEIYVLGGSINDAPSNHVWILDCRFHAWRFGPPMKVARAREFAQVPSFLCSVRPSPFSSVRPSTFFPPSLPLPPYPGPFSKSKSKQRS